MLHNVLSRTRWSTGALPVGVIKRSLQIRPSNAPGHNPPNGAGRGPRGAGREYRPAERNARDSSVLLLLRRCSFSRSLPSCACGRAHLHRATRDHPRSGRSIDIDQAAGEDARKTCGCSSYFARRQITGRAGCTVPQPFPFSAIRPRKRCHWWDIRVIIGLCYLERLVCLSVMKKFFRQRAAEEATSEAAPGSAAEFYVTSGSSFGRCLSSPRFASSFALLPAFCIFHLPLPPIRYAFPSLRKPAICPATRKLVNCGSRGDRNYDFEGDGPSRIFPRAS